VPPLLQSRDRGYVWFLESLDAIHRAIQGRSDLREALDAALGVLLEMLGADRAWLLEAHGDAWTAVMERTRPEYPGGLEHGVQEPFTPETSAVHERVLTTDSCIQFEPGEVASTVLPDGVSPPRAILAMAIHPKPETPWILGLHQCSHARTWSREEQRVFVEIGHRLSDAVRTLLAYRDVRESEQKLVQAQRVARLGYWERDVSTFEVDYSEGTYEVFGLASGLHTLSPARLAERLHPDDRHIMVDAYEAAIAGGPRYDVDYRVLLPSGETRFVHSEADVIWDADGRPLRMFGVLQDVSDRKQAEERLLRSQESLAALAREQEALRRVATMVARATSPEEVFATVTEEVGRLLGLDLAFLARYDAETETIVAAWRPSGSLDSIGKTTRLGGENVSTIVHATGRPARIEGYGDATGEVAAVRRAWGVRAIVGVPIVVEGEIRGVMAVASTSEAALPGDTEERLASFTELLATAYANAEAREALRRVADEQAALRRVATLVARGEPADEVFAAIADEVAGLFAADATLVMRYLPGDIAEVVGSWSTHGPLPAVGERTSLREHDVTALVFHGAGPARIDRYQDDAGPNALGRQLGIQSAVGVPIRVGGRLWGMLAVASARESSMTAGAEGRLAGFGDLAATAIANAEAREALRRVADEQAALRRVATLVARGTQPDLVFAAVAEEVGSLLTAVELALVGRYLPDGSIEYVGAWSAHGEAEWLGNTVPLGGRNVSTAVFESGRPARVDHLDDDASAVTALARGSGARSSAGAPIAVEGRLWGVMIAASGREAVLPPNTERELAAFTELLATAIANAEARAELTASRARIVTSADDARRRIARDLHDGAQSRLVQTIITLDLARRAHDADDPEQVQDLLRDARAQAGRANTELRELVQGIHPAGLARGLAPAIEDLVERLRIPVAVDVPQERFRPEIEATAYFVVAEALTNVVKHSGARQAWVTVDVAGPQLSVEVRDDGCGGASTRGGGLRGLADRTEALGGRLTIESPRAGGTRITAALPR
jgi:signal transduction histidine kinase/PAS domain-containing protein